MAKHDDEFEGRDTVTLTLDDDSELECIVLNIFKGGDRAVSYTHLTLPTTSRV